MSRWIKFVIEDLEDGVCWWLRLTLLDSHRTKLCNVALSHILDCQIDFIQPTRRVATMKGILCSSPHGYYFCFYYVDNIWILCCCLIVSSYRKMCSFVDDMYNEDWGTIGKKIAGQIVSIVTCMFMGWMLLTDKLKILIVYTKLQVGH